MDETEFRTAHAEVNDRPCAFSKAILMRCCGCSRSQKVFIAERETVACLSPGAQARCAEMVGLLREKALFALKMPRLEERLPHGKEVKVECGAMLGLQAALGTEADTVEDIHALLERALDRYGTPADLPYAEIVKYISRFTPRKRRGAPRE